MVYFFGDGKAEGSAGLKNLLGGKGANLAEMSSLGLPVPPGFTITTELCTYYYDHGRSYPPELSGAVDKALSEVGRLTNRVFGDKDNPLLVSVRSGARASMPGMMDTVLNLGLNDDTVLALARQAGDERFAQDSYRRFITMFSDVVLGVDHHHFEDILEEYKEARGLSFDTDLSADDLKELVVLYKRLVQDKTGKPFPQEPKEQLWGAIGAVFASWMNPRAIKYRELNDIPASWGTAVNVQAMVFAIWDKAAPRRRLHPQPLNRREHALCEFLINAQGEDVVAGIRTPQDITEAARKAAKSRMPSMETAMPPPSPSLCGFQTCWSGTYRDMQDMEFTVERGKLWICRPALRQAHGQGRAAHRR